jgi:hypothetical protein
MNIDLMAKEARVRFCAEPLGKVPQISMGFAAAEAVQSARFV